MAEPPRQPDARPPSAGKCPICGRTLLAEGEAYPFCSKRCRQIDLGRWLDGGYVISRPVEESDLDEGE